MQKHVNAPLYWAFNSHTHT